MTIPDRNPADAGAGGAASSRAGEPARPTIVIDTREQSGWSFDGISTIVETLKTGDYSLLGFESEIVIERKATGDAIKSVMSGKGGKGGERKRFKAEWRRMEAIVQAGGYAAVVIECTQEALAGYKSRHTRASGVAVVGTYKAWSEAFGIPVYYIPGRDKAGTFARGLMLAEWCERTGNTLPAEMTDPGEAPAMGDI